MSGWPKDWFPPLETHYYYMYAKIKSCSKKDRHAVYRTLLQNAVWMNAAGGVDECCRLCASSSMSLPMQVKCDALAPPWQQLERNTRGRIFLHEKLVEE